MRFLPHRILPRHARLPLPGVLLGAAALVLAALAVATHMALGSDYRDQVQLALRDADRDAQTLAWRVHEVLAQVDQATRLVKALNEAQNPMTLAGLKQASLAADDVTSAILLCDAHGRALASTSAEPTPNIASLDDFKRHAHDLPYGSDTRQRLTLGPLLPDIPAGAFSIPAMRRLNGEDGHFNGVVLALIDPGALTRDAGIEARAGALKGVIGLDNIYLSRQLNGKLSVGDRMNTQDLLAAVQSVHDTLEPHTSPIDGVRRFLAVAPVDGYPLYAVVGESAEGVLATYQQTRLRTLVGAGAMGLVVLCGTGFLWRQIRHLDESRRRARTAEAVYRATSEGSLDALFVLRAVRDAAGHVVDFRFTEANTRGLRLLQTGQETLLGSSLRQRLPLLCSSGYLGRCIAAMRAAEGFEIEVRVADADALNAGWLHLQTVALEDGIAVISRDITESKAMQRQLLAMATTDALTQVSNRRHFEAMLAQAAARAQRSGKALALIYIDLDGFKRINDTLGHEVGDQLLVEVATRLRACVRGTDHVSRLGGDEFTVILEDAGNDDDRLQQCERLLDQLSRSHLVAGHNIVSTPSIGMALYRPGEPLSSLRKRADAAMHEAKSAGKACLRVASGELRPGR